MTHRSKAAALAALLIALPVSGGALAATFASREQCLTKAEAAPDFALVEARLWARQGGGTDARLCEAMALLLQGSWSEAGMALEAVLPDLAREPADIRAALWARAGTAWTKVPDLSRAAAAFARAAALMPREPGYRIDRAGVLAAEERYWDVLAELDAALALAPDNAEALLLRAEARRKLGRPTEALADLTSLLAAAPTNAEALLMRGNMMADAGRFDEARADWTAAAAAAGDAGAGRAASANLAALAELEADNSGPTVPKTR